MLTNTNSRQPIILGAYMIVFGLAIALLGKRLAAAAKSGIKLTTL